MMKNICTLLLVCGIVAMVQCIPKESYPNPVTNPTRCWNHTNEVPNNLRLCDPDRIISDEQAVNLNNLANGIRMLGACPCNRQICHVSKLLNRGRGYTVTIALVKSMDLTKQGNLVGQAGDYATYLRQSAGYSGPRFYRCEDDIIILVAFKEKVVYILTGNMARPKVTDIEVADILTDSKPSFGKQVADGVEYILNRIKSEILKR